MCQQPEADAENGPKKSFPYMNIRVLLTATLFSTYIMHVMASYLIEVWGLSFTHAAGIANVFWGLSLIFPFALQLFSDSFLGNFKVISITHVCYSAGFIFLALSTPPMLSSATGTCKEFKEECVGNVQKIMFYTALPLIAIGIASHIALIPMSFIDEQQAKRCEQSFSWTDFLQFLAPIAGFVALLFIDPWEIRFGIPAICTTCATFLFLSGSRSYEKDGPKGGPLGAFFKVLFASALKIFLKANPTDLYEEEDLEDNDPKNFLKHTTGLRCLDKASIKLPDKSVEQQRWTLCTVTEVEQTKLLVKSIPISLTFFIPGLVSSIGTTFFLEQADRMNPMLGHLKLPRPFLMVFFILTKQSYENYCQNSPRIGVAFSMIFATLSCIIAAIVEKQRIRVATRQGLLDSADETVSMSMFWVLPQFFLLALADGISSFSIRKGLLRKGYPKYMTKYMRLITKVILGLGTLSSVLVVYVVGKVTGGGRQQSWFQSSLNTSRLDNYFWTLAGISAVNFLVYVVVAIFYNPPTGDEPTTKDLDFEKEYRLKPVRLLLSIPVFLASLVISLAATIVWIIGLMLSFCIPIILALAMSLIQLPLAAVQWITIHIPF